MIYYDVVVVGCGMVGLSTAISLQKKGIQTAIIDTKKLPEKLQDKKSRIETRVCAINHNSQNFLKEIDVWQQIKEDRISPYYSMNVWDNNAENSISITCEEMSEHNLGFIIENSLIEFQLLQKAKEIGVTILDNLQITNIDNNINNQYAVINFNKNSKDIHTSLVVGSDGANSFVRKSANFEINQTNYNHKAIVATIKLEKSHNQEAFQKFYKDGIIAFLPLKNKNKCSIVWSLNTNIADKIINLETKEFLNELKKTINNKYGELDLETNIFSFELILRHVKQYYKNKVVLIGDACHTIHPLAGQGVNLGFKDSISLSNIIIKAFEKERIIGDISTLDEYQRQRRLDNKKMIFLMKAFKQGFAIQNPLITKIRRIGLNFVNNKNHIKKLIVKQAL